MMMMMKILAGAMLAALAACASSGRVGDLPTVAQNAPHADLAVIRVSSLVGATNSYFVALDGKDVFSLRNGTYTKFPIPTGEHFIAVKCFGGWSPTWKEDSKGFTASDGATNYFEISPNLRCAEIIPISGDDGKKAISGSTFVSPETVSR